MVPAITFMNVCREILGLMRNLSESTLWTYCRRHIGVSFEVCADVWNQITKNDTMPIGAKPEHLIWALMKINMYDTDIQQATATGVDPHTSAAWVWKMLEAIVSIKSSVVRLMLLY